VEREKESGQEELARRVVHGEGVWGLGGCEGE
jgi:hypothetical protein